MASESNSEHGDWYLELSQIFSDCAIQNDPSLPTVEASNPQRNDLPSGSVLDDDEAYLKSSIYLLTEFTVDQLADKNTKVRNRLLQKMPKAERKSAKMLISKMRRKKKSRSYSRNRRRRSSHERTNLQDTVKRYEQLIENINHTVLNYDCESSLRMVLEMIANHRYDF
ncbi:hypothetical protein TrispH2_000860 [Trichoplax sp. H2]|nr:hypothetical protein TrispH2_000860 [Trichoplax sp. H2]|eukprot:RDD47538.1 hypothetical protein TrispH2_000860 [Trichoplax sp. H2]